jgi:hypothetical protein
MEVKELKMFDNKQVVVRMRDGTRRTGRFFVTPEEGLYHVTRDPERAGQVVGGLLEDLWGTDILEVSPLR